jgi:hypothetical protein
MVDTATLGDEIATLAAKLSAGTHELLTCIRQFDAAEGWHHQGALTCAHWLTWRISVDPATAREKIRVARALGALPRIDGAFAQGRLSYAQVRAMTRVATHENEENLLMIAQAANAHSSNASAAASGPRRRRSWAGRTPMRRRTGASAHARSAAGW